MHLPGVGLSIPGSASESYRCFPGLAKLPQSLFSSQRRAPAKFVWIYKGIWSAHFLPRELAFRIEIEAAWRKQNIDVHAAHPLYPLKSA